MHGPDLIVDLHALTSAVQESLEPTRTGMAGRTEPSPLAGSPVEGARGAINIWAVGGGSWEQSPLGHANAHVSRRGANHARNAIKRRIP